MESSETSSSDQESDEYQQQVVQDEIYPQERTKARSYDCTFCKRGFTNARALGGHMNIHRKERTNNKVSIKQAAGTPPNSIEGYSIMAFPFVVPQVLSSQPSSMYHVTCTLHPSSATNNLIRNHPPNTFQYDFDLNTTRNQQELLGTNLSLQIGSSTHGDIARGIDEKDGEGVLDLELRLGHHSYSNLY